MEYSNQLLHELWQLFSVLCSDDTLWKRKLQSDFNFSGQGTARTSGWKFIYRGLSKPRGRFRFFAINNYIYLCDCIQYSFGGKIIFTLDMWFSLSFAKALFTPKFSEKTNGRLGRSDYDLPKSIISGVPYPIEVPLPGIRVVSLIAGGTYVSLRLSLSHLICRLN